MMYLRDVNDKDLKQEPTRMGFGRGLVEAGRRDERVVAASADLTDSTKMGDFAREYPERFIEIGVAEQNLVTVGAGLAAMGKIPFVSSYAAFSPGRNWEQIRTTICLNDQPVKVIGSHAGLSVGPDGATHQMLEDISLMRTLPNMMVLSPCDSIEAEKMTIAIANSPKPAYMRLTRENSPVFTTTQTPSELGKAQVFAAGSDLTILATGVMTYQALLASEKLYKQGIDAEVIHVSCIKPLDAVTIIKSAKKTGRVITIEEHQINGGFGSAIAELLGEHQPTLMRRIGVKDRFGESGTPTELFKHFGLTADHVVTEAHALMEDK